MCCSATSLLPLVSSRSSRIPPSLTGSTCASPTESDTVQSPTSDCSDGVIHDHIDIVPADSRKCSLHHLTDYPGDNSRLHVVIPDMDNRHAGPLGDEIDLFLHDSLHFERNSSFLKQLDPKANAPTLPFSPTEAILTSFTTYNLNAQSYSRQFLVGHTLNPHFVWICLRRHTVSITR
ncbi:hypothetical protein AX15_005383 [Amanita polypyramis BW_CC]|nr:hypothetical protein AX15_005383 [Amanita polypyramis BW_CC]